MAKAPITTKNPFVKRKLKAKKLLAIGSFLIFLSWGTQNVVQQHWLSRMQELDDNTNYVATHNIVKNIYNAFLMEGLDRDGLQSYNYGLHLNSLIVSAKDAADGGESHEANQQWLLDENAKYDVARKSKDVHWLRTAVDTMKGWEFDEGKVLHDLYVERRQHLQSRTNNWRNAYLTLYVLGGLFLALSFKVEYGITRDGG